jgi:hypothetical protein
MSNTNNNQGIDRKEELSTEAIKKEVDRYVRDRFNNSDSQRHFNVWSCEKDYKAGIEKGIEYTNTVLSSQQKGGNVDQIKRFIDDARNQLYNSLPTGEVNTFDLLNVIRYHINTLDAIVAGEPPYDAVLSSQKGEEAIAFLKSADKPFFIDHIRKLIQLYDKEEISMSKLTEVLNLEALDWLNKTGIPASGQPSYNSMEELFKYKDKIMNMTDVDIDKIANKVIPKNEG